MIFSKERAKKTPKNTSSNKNNSQRNENYFPVKLGKSIFVAVLGFDSGPCTC
jgi:hypothetical protein